MWDPEMMSYGAVTLGGSCCLAINHLSTVQSAELCPVHCHASGRSAVAKGDEITKASLSP